MSRGDDRPRTGSWSQKISSFLSKIPRTGPVAREMADESTSRTEEYLLLLNEHERSLAAYVHTLVNDRGDAEDILQACRITMWKKFDDFESGTHFLAWARRIALHQVLNYRRSAKRKPRYSLDPDLIESIASAIDHQSEELDERSEALRACLRKLPENHRKTVLLRYFEGLEIDEIAKRTRRSEGAVYRLLSRIRAALGRCVSETVHPSAP